MFRQINLENVLNHCHIIKNHAGYLPKSAPNGGQFSTWLGAARSAKLCQGTNPGLILDNINLVITSAAFTLKGYWYPSGSSLKGLFKGKNCDAPALLWPVILIGLLFFYYLHYYCNTFFVFGVCLAVLIRFHSFFHFAKVTPNNSLGVWGVAEGRTKTNQDFAVPAVT